MTNETKKIYRKILFKISTILLAPLKLFLNVAGFMLGIVYEVIYG